MQFLAPAILLQSLEDNGKWLNHFAISIFSKVISDWIFYHMEAIKTHGKATHPAGDFIYCKPHDTSQTRNTRMLFCMEDLYPWLLLKSFVGQ